MQFYEFSFCIYGFSSAIESSCAVIKILDSVGSVSQAHCTLERPSTFRMSSSCWSNSRKSCVPGLMFGGKNNSSTRRTVVLASSAKTPEATATAKSNGDIILTSD